MESLFVPLAVVAVVKLIDLISERDFASASKIVAAALIGASAGLLGVENLNVFTGIQAGLMASGIVTTAKIFAK